MDSVDVNDNGVKVQLLEQILSDDSKGYSVRIISAADDVLIDAIDLDTANNLYTTMTDKDILFFV